MQSIQLSIILLSMRIAAAWAQADPNSPPQETPPALEPGKEVRLKIDAEPNEILVYVPADYDDASAWPVVFYFHGQGEPLSTERFQIATDGKGFIIVALEFTTASPGKMNQAQYLAYLQRELKNIAHATIALRSRLNINPKAFILAGVSRGGWLVSDMFVSRPGPWAAVAIMCAGYHGTPTERRESLADKFVYIGAGETDQNLPAAKRAGTYFRKRGANVVIDQYPNLGHAVDPSSPKLKAWFSTLREKLQPPPPDQTLPAKDQSGKIQEDDRPKTIYSDKDFVLNSGERVRFDYTQKPDWNWSILK